MKTQNKNLEVKIAQTCSGSCVLQNELLAPYTTFKVGGAAEYFIEPKDETALLAVLDFLRREGLDVFILGGGSNIVVADTGISGVVLSMRRLDGVKQSGNTDLLCGCGARFDAICSFCEKNALGGLEKFNGLPGTAGGAVYMNARCYEKSISDAISFVDYIDLNTLEVKRSVFDADDWDYKKSPFQQKNRLVLSTCFKVHSENAQEICDLNAFYLADRKNRRQFDFPSAGSVFKNNRTFGAPSGKIIDLAGLCGTRIGGAQIAPWHGNFIINMGNATACNIRELTEFVIERVSEKTGFMLEPEIMFIGF